MVTQLAELTVAHGRTDEQLRALVQTQTRTEGELRELIGWQREFISWQRGEAGRRDGERYERDILRQAPALFNGGHGGPTDAPDVQRQLTTQLGAI